MDDPGVFLVGGDGFEFGVFVDLFFCFGDFFCLGFLKNRWMVLLFAYTFEFDFDQPNYRITNERNTKMKEVGVISVPNCVDHRSDLCCFRSDLCCSKVIL